MTFDDCRPEVKAFAMVMEKKLLENDHKSGWKRMSLTALIGRLLEESAELCDEMNEPRLPNHFLFAQHHVRLAARMLTDGYHERELPRRVSMLAGEAADVANFAMMVADVCGGLSPGERRMISGCHPGSGDAAKEEP